jgi:haloalkane dehalogenase
MTRSSEASASPSWLDRDAYPSRIVWGMKDTAFPPCMLDRWRRLLPQATVVTLAGAGHWPHEEEPEVVVRAIRGFIGTPPPTAA